MSEDKRHPHYATIMRWASDPERWKVEAFSPARREWLEEECRCWNPNTVYRLTERDREMLHINGMKFRAPLREEPMHGCKVYVANPTNPDFPVPHIWHGEEFLKQCLFTQTLHEDKEAAIEHGRAMLCSKPVEEEGAGCSPAEGEEFMIWVDPASAMTSWLGTMAGDNEERRDSRKTKEAIRPPEIGDYGWAANRLEKVLSERLLGAPAFPLEGFADDETPYCLRGGPCWRYFLRHEDGAIFGPNLEVVG